MGSDLFFCFVCPPPPPPPPDRAVVGVLSAKRRLTFMLGPQERPVLPAGRCLGECGNAVMLSDEGCSTYRSCHPPPPPAPARQKVGAPVYASPTRVDGGAERKRRARRDLCADECGNMQMLLIHLSAVTDPPSASTSLACPFSH